MQFDRGRNEEQTEGEKSEKVIVGEAGVTYGLEVRHKAPTKGAAMVRRSSVFGDDDDDDDDDEVVVGNNHQTSKRQGGHPARGGGVGAMIARQAASKQKDAKVLEMQAMALKEDAAIFDYDSHYDDVQKSRMKPKQEEKMQRESKYIAHLLHTAEERKREQEVLYEKRLAKEREAEDILFGDKEKFVTSAYKKKLEEAEKWKMEQKKKKEEEEREAVEKRGHMGDFYRNLFKKNVDYQKTTMSEKMDGGIGGKEEKGAAPAVGARVAERNEEREIKESDTKTAMVKEPLHVRTSAEEKPGVSAREMPGPARDAEEGKTRGPVTRPPSSPSIKEDATNSVAAADTAKRKREEKIAGARERYLARKRQAAAPTGGVM